MCTFNKVGKLVEKFIIISLFYSGFTVTSTEGLKQHVLQP